MGLISWQEDSELGAWRQLSLRPGRLAGLVESIWLFDGTLSRRERYYPTGELDLIIHLDAPAGPFRIVEGQPAAASPASCLAGLLVAPLVIDGPTTTSRMAGVRLRPAGAFALFGLPLHELTGTAVDLRDVIGGEARRLAERLAEADSDQACLRILARWITDRLAAHTMTSPAVAYAVTEIERTGGRSPISTVLGRIDTSPRRFAGVFEQQVGVKPKLFARIVRFRELVAALPVAGDTLSATALAHGYYDQPHMNADFREFTGLSPRQFLAATRYPESQSLAD